MHSLMNRFNNDEQRRLMQLLGVEESFAPSRSRRVFLQSAGAAGLVIGFGWLAPGSAEAALPGEEGAATGPLAPNAFVRVGTNNLVTVICKHHEMGQGNTTGLASLVADELDADWSLVRTEYAPSDAKLYNNLAFGPMQGTGGSSAISIRFFNIAAPALPRGPCSSRRRPRPGTCRPARSARRRARSRTHRAGVPPTARWRWPRAGKRRPTIRR